jgi:orotate phosphoribosyltransferase
MNPTEVLAVLEERGAVQTGHFKLSSGRHSDTFVQKFRVLEHPRLAQALGEALADRYEHAFDVVASPAVGAIVLGFVVALAAGKRFVFAERVNGSLSLRRGFDFEPHERVLVVEDVITTGGSVREVVDLVRSAGAVPVGVAALIDRADPARVDIGVRVEPLVKLRVGSWDAESCPLCEKGAPFSDPGSRRIRSASSVHRAE